MRRSIWLMFLVLSLLILTGCSGIPGNTSTSPASTPSPAVSPTLDPSAPAPLSVYIVQGGSITALTAADGTLRWNTGIQGRIVNPPLLLAGTLYIGTDLGYVAAFRATDGKTLWTYQAGDGLLALLVALNDGLYFATPTTVGALKPADGTLLWHTPVSFAGDSTLHLFVVDGTVFVGPADPESPHGMLALNASDGSVRWRYQIGQHAAVLLSAADGNVYVEEPLHFGPGAGAGVSEDVLHVLNASNGKERWHFAKTQQRSDIVAMGQGVIYMLTYGSSTADTNLLSALNISDGSARWNTPLQSDQIGQWFTINGTLYLDTVNGSVYAFSANDGKSHAVLSSSPSQPTPASVFFVSNGVLYGNAAPQPGLVAFNTSDWSLKWSYHTQDSIGITSTINGIAYGATYNQNTSTQTKNYVYALKEGAQTLLWRYDIGSTIAEITVG